MLCRCSADEVADRSLSSLPDPEDFEPAKRRLDRMVIVGHTTPTSARLWVHVPRSGAYALCLSPAKFRGAGQAGDISDMGGLRVEDYMRGQRDVSILSRSFDDPHELNHTFEFTGLTEDTVYYYLLAAELGTEGEGGDRTLVGVRSTEYFRTAKSSYDRIRFAAYSCHDPYSTTKDKAAVGAWPQLAAIRDELDLTLGGGDQVYVDSNELGMTDLWVWLREHRAQIEARYVDTGGKVDEASLRDFLTRLIRHYYRIYWNFPDLRRVYGRVPSYMMWDDHEIMDGWGSLTKEERISKLRKKHGYDSDDDKLLRLVEVTFEAAVRVYAEYQHSHNPGPPYTGNPRTFVWDFSFRRGDYHFFLMDMRGHHNCEAGCDRLLGPDQHGRLRDWLDGLDGAEAAFVLSPVPVVHWAGIVEYSQIFISSLKDDLMDAWQHPTNHDERARLLDALFGASERFRVPVTIVSGDVHCASAYTLSDPDNYPNAKVLQVTSSSISRVPVGSMGTLAFARTGHMPRRVEDGRGKEVKTSVYQRRCFAKAGVCNFAVISAEGDDVTVEFRWPDGGGGVKTAAVDLKW